MDRPKLPFPILPVAIAAISGFAAGLALSIVVDQRSAAKAKGPCPECADKELTRALEEQVRYAVAHAERTAPVEVTKVYDQTKTEVVGVVVPVESESVDAGD